MPKHFEAAAEMVTEEQVAEKVVCGPDPEQHLEAIREYEQAGFDARLRPPDRARPGRASSASTAERSCRSSSRTAVRAGRPARRASAEPSSASSRCRRCTGSAHAASSAIPFASPRRESRDRGPGRDLARLAHGQEAPGGERPGARLEPGVRRARPRARASCSRARAARPPAPPERALDARGSAPAPRLRRPASPRAACAAPGRASAPRPCPTDGRRGDRQPVRLGELLLQHGQHQTAASAASDLLLGALALGARPAPRLELDADPVGDQRRDERGATRRAPGRPRSAGCTEAEEHVDAVGRSRRRRRGRPRSAAPSPIAVRSGASRGRSSRLWKRVVAASSAARATARGRGSRRRRAGRATPPQNGFGTSV